MKILIRNIIRLHRSFQRRVTKLVVRNQIHKIGCNFICDQDVVVYGGEYIEIGEKVTLNRWVLLQSCEGARITIGNNVTLSYDVKIITGNLTKGSLDVNNIREHNSESVQIGDNVWVGASVVILPGVSIASNTIIAAGSVVNKSINRGGTLFAGSPAKFIKDL